jgi:hypothetical protein
LTDLAVFYEHPAWFRPLFAALDRRGLDWRPIAIQDHTFDPGEVVPPASVIFNRLAMSSFVRQGEHALAYMVAALDHWQGLGARVINGVAPLSIDLSKARQLNLFRRAGLSVPATRIAHRLVDVSRLAGEIGFPVMVKVNVGGSGTGMARYDHPDQLSDALRDGLVAASVDQVVLVQAYLPPRDGAVIRCETLAGRFLYAIALRGAGTSFDLCPADVCLADRAAIQVSAFEPPADIIAGVERVARLAGLDVGGVEYLVDDQDGKAKFYDFNALSNFVANPLEVLGFDPHDNLVDFLVSEVAASARAAA